MTDKTYMPAITNTYRTSDVAKLLNISAPNVRKHAAALEEAGASITRDERAERIFSEQDLKALQHMRKLVAKGATLADAGVQAAVLLRGERQQRAEAGEVVQAADREVFAAMTEKLQTLLEDNASLREQNSRVMAQNARILEGQRRMESLLIETAQPAGEEKPDKKRPWWRLFG